MNIQFHQTFDVYMKYYFQSKQWAPLPYVIYTTLSVISFCLATWLPETKGKPVPETIEELENLKK